MRALVVMILAASSSAIGLPLLAHAQGPAPSAEDTARAEALNDQGKVLFSEEKDYAGAAEKFRLAISLLPDARYFYNLCAALEKLGRYEDALNACDSVFTHQPRPELAQKTGAKS